MEVSFFKRYSTYANGIQMVLAAGMVYFPDIVPDHVLPYVMCTCSMVIAGCQFIKQGVKQ